MRRLLMALVAASTLAAGGAAYAGQPGCWPGYHSRVYYPPVRYLAPRVAYYPPVYYPPVVAAPYVAAPPVVAPVPGNFVSFYGRNFGVRFGF